MYREFRPGQTVRTIYGQLRTVIEQIGCQVFVVEEHGHYHPEKLFPVDQFDPVKWELDHNRLPRATPRWNRDLAANGYDTIEERDMDFGE